jgi:hypothetical protein
MRPMRKNIVAVSAATLLMFGAAGASASTTPWQVMPTPNVSSSDVDLAGVSCAGASDCMAVSSDGTALYWDGSTWAVRPAVFGAGPEDVELYGISCTSETFCMAAGEAAPGDAAAWLWDGSTWTAMAANVPKSTDNYLYAITCTSSAMCEAVGERGNGNGGTTFPLAEFWNGKKWMERSTKGSPPGSLDGVACESAWRCEAVGTNTYSLNVLAMGLSGSRWVRQSTPKALFSPTGVSCWSSGCTAVGGTNSHVTLAESWDGRKWELQGAPGEGAPSSNASNWNAVQCASTSSCTTVGEIESTSGNSTLISDWNGKAWRQVPSPDPGTDDSLNGIACTSENSICTAVGTYGTSDGFGHTLAMRS